VTGIKNEGTGEIESFGIYSSVNSLGQMPGVVNQVFIAACVAALQFKILQF
jgi:hypothetical protein